MFQLITDWDRPNRFDNKKRDEEYHSNWGRYAIANGFNQMHSEHINQMSVNTNFFFDRQWVMEEDKESFFKDSSNQSRNRIKVVKNFIKPTILQYMGNAIIMDMTIQASSISVNASNRREEQLSELLYYTEVANNSSPRFGGLLRSKMLIGNTPEETQQMFENTYKDDFVKGINYFMDYISKENKLEEKKYTAAFDLTRSGMALMEYFVHANEFKWKRLLPEQFFFDRTAKEPDLSDAGYMGKYEEMLPSQIFERWPNMRQEDREAIEVESKNTSNYNNYPYSLNGRIYVYTVYWMDFENQEYGYVEDEFGYQYLVRINHIYEDEEKPRYTDKDLVALKDLNDSQKTILRGSNKVVIPVDLMRFIEFIPNEIVPPGQSNTGTPRKDIVLGSGIFPWQDTENEKIDNVAWPIKVSTWIYHKGFIDTPVSSLINPQRMINRYASVEEQQISSAHGKSLFYDRQIIGLEGEDEMLSNLYQGKPTAVNSKGQGLHNMMGEFGTSIGDDTLVYETLQKMMKDTMDSIIGINDTMRGENQPANKLVGVTQLEIQRSSLVQEPFYDAIVRLFLQVYQATANVGKRVYVANKRKLAIAVGDNYTEVLMLTKEYNAEDFRVFIAREPDKKKQVAAANELLFFLKDRDLIDEVGFGELYNNATMDEIAGAVRKYSREKMLIAKDQEEARKQQEEAMAIDEETQRQEIREDTALSRAADSADKERDRMAKKDINIQKLASNERVKQSVGQKG